MKRRDFFRSTAFLGLASIFGSDKIRAIGATEMAVAQSPDLVAVMGGEPEDMLVKALKEMGGIKKFVKKGQKVVIKPNIGWDRVPELAGNTNPKLIKKLTELCLKEAGAKEVIVFDHTCDNWQKTYKNSGIQDAVEEAGGKMVPGNDQSMYREHAFPKGIKLKKALVHQAILDCDVWFNVPVLKNHGGSKMTISMKNLMGIVWDRQFFHSNDLHQCIADSCTIDKKPALNIVDAYRVVKTNGPQGRSASDVAVLKTLLISPDFVAVDTAAVKFFNQVQAQKLEDVKHIFNGQNLKIGTTNLDAINIKRIKI
ncbi:MAG: DUF362 domain-containing protein [Bacteroidales bacterium]|jgi:uncharacterized protein (DUF362 family)|nr:DUF362 domain-containing protein [Bacteroidales bacterium]MDD3161662.1 DUF362 domain-containing protein [Bacteroidales bacterium]